MWVGLEEFSFTLKDLKKATEDTLHYGIFSVYHPDTTPSICAARQLANMLDFPEFDFQISMSHIGWNPGSAHFLMHLIKVTDSEVFEILKNANKNMSIRYLTLGNKYDQFKKDILKLYDTLKTFISFADALRHSDHIY